MNIKKVDDNPMVTVDYSEKEKKFSKTELVKKPFEAKKKLYQRMGNSSAMYYDMTHKNKNISVGTRLRLSSS